MSDRHEKCAEAGCDRAVVTRAWCGAHYQRGLADGSIQRLPKAPRTCAVDGCDRPRKGTHRFCVAHEYRKKAWGDVGADVPIQVKDGTRPVTGHPLFRTWDGIKARTTNPRSTSWPYYGGRGIAMHPAWLADATEFYRWVEDNLGPRPDGHTLDRIDNDGNYEPGNLRWATAVEQQANTRRSHPLTDEQVARIEAAR